MSALIRRKTVDKNGKHTTVYVKETSVQNHARMAAMPPDKVSGEDNPSYLIGKQNEALTKTLQDKFGAGAVIKRTGIGELSISLRPSLTSITDSPLKALSDAFSDVALVIDYSKSIHQYDSYASRRTNEDVEDTLAIDGKIEPTYHLSVNGNRTELLGGNRYDRELFMAQASWSRFARLIS